MKIIISNASSDPIYDQVRNQIKNQIISGDLNKNDPLPSIRKLAKELQISVITIKRAYEELEKEGFIDTVGGKGCFVSAQSDDLLKEKKMKNTEDILAEAVQIAKKYGLSLKEMKDMLSILFNEEG